MSVTFTLLDVRQPVSFRGDVDCRFNFFACVKREILVSILHGVLHGHRGHPTRDFVALDSGEVSLAIEFYDSSVECIKLRLLLLSRSASGTDENGCGYAYK